MRAFRYDTSGRWFKGNVHVHSVASDGGKTFAELAELYASAGYDFLFRTDHWVSSNTADDQASYPLLWLDGVELDGTGPGDEYAHVLCLGRVQGIEREDGMRAALEAAHRQGALCILAHPQWSGNSLGICAAWHLDGIEIYNHVCRWLNGKGDGATYWNAALEEQPSCLSFAVDDTHLRPEHPGWNGGWIVVNAAECSAEALIAAIRAGNFYSSCGPKLRSIELEGDELHLVTSPVQFARLAGPKSLGARVGAFNGSTFTDVRMPIPEDWDYVYAEVEDRAGRRAWTNPLFTTNTPS